MKQAWLPLPPGGLYEPIRKLWIQGNGWKRIAKLVGRPVERVRDIIHELGLTAEDRIKPPPPANGRRADEFQRDIMADLFAAGHGYKSIAKQLRMAHGTVVRTCREMGLRKTERSGKAWESPARVPRGPNPIVIQADAFAREQSWVRRNETFWHLHQEALRFSYRKTEERKRRSSPAHRIMNYLRTRLRLFVKRPNKMHMKVLVGCTGSELRAHFERYFKPGMTWDNQGRKGWHIDHVKPCRSFDLNDPHQQRLCFHFSNLRPIWASDNIKKGDKMRNGMRAKDIPLQLGLGINDGNP